jgi:hypothetical protein
MIAGSELDCRPAADPPRGFTHTLLDAMERAREQLDAFPPLCVPSA